MTKNEPTGLSILVVDDFYDARHMLRRMLEMRGYQVAEAADGKQAVAEARRSCPDLILMDLHMPFTDGLTAARRIRACEERCSKVPLVAITAYHATEMDEAARQAGFDDYLVKPIDFDQLDRVLRRFVPG